ncbi:MAG: cell wall metabolism sensor histidine kinase WalK [Firmicutes bacterium]|nr:cell wall metabolism sensor histidine kinase WalK [Bacillota bacterium]
MFRKWKPASLFGKLLAAHLVVIVITMLAIGFFLTYLVEKYFFSAREYELVSKAENVAGMLAEEFHRGSFDEVEKMAQTLAYSLDMKIRVFTPDKEEMVIALPEDDPDEDEVGLESSEIDQVLEGNTMSKKMYGPGIQQLLVAMPVMQESQHELINSNGTPSKVIGVITVSAPLTGITATIAQISRLTFYSGILATIVAGILAFSLAKNISLPLQAMTKAARELVKGNFKSRIKVNTTGELQELAATFNQAVDEVERTVAEQKRLQALRQNLVANVSHEFRAPLTSIQGFADAMLEGFVTEEERERYLQVIIDNTLHLNRLVNDLLDLSSLESGHVQLTWGSICPRKLAAKALHSIESKAQEKNIDLEYHFSEELALVWGDENRLYQVLINLLENALTYTQPGGQISLLIKEKDNKIIFTVKDDGCGIPPADLPHIWDRFYKVDKARNRAQKGKGLGLAIARELVHLHHGRVTASSTPGRGSSFSVLLPAFFPPEQNMN